MHREYLKWWSPSLGKEMEMLIFGHGGTPVLVFPSSRGRFFEWEDFKMFEAVRDKIDQGFNRFFCVDSIDDESFYNYDVPPYIRMMRYGQYDRYIMDEVLPLIHDRCQNHFIIASGASFGAYHAGNFAFKYPGAFGKLIAMSGKYDIKGFVHGHYDNNVYFNNPVDFLPNLDDHSKLEALRRMDIRLLAGDHDICLEPTRYLSHILNNKAIPHTLDIWGGGRQHDWPLWRSMIAAHLH